MVRNWYNQIRFTRRMTRQQVDWFGTNNVTEALAAFPSALIDPMPKPALNPEPTTARGRRRSKKK